MAFLRKSTSSGDHLTRMVPLGNGDYDFEEVIITGTGPRSVTVNTTHGNKVKLSRRDLSNNTWFK